tara:strand:- start:2374 stop:3933 length:1560 start_codon:yes stop_codon:yes gene_type:complete
MGGARDGQYAAQAAIAQLSDFRPHQSERHTIAEHISQHFEDANTSIVQHAGGPGLTGSTLSLLHLEERHFHIGHIGDSRIYLFRADQLHQLTQDDVGPAPHESGLLHALGKHTHLPHSPYIPCSPEQSALQAGDLFLLCSDGCSGFLTNEKIAQRLSQLQQQLVQGSSQAAQLSWASDLLIQDAFEAGSDDNVSLLLLHISEVPDKKTPTTQVRQTPPSSTMSSPSTPKEEPTKIAVSEQPHVVKHPKPSQPPPSFMPWVERIVWFSVVFGLAGALFVNKKPPTRRRTPTPPPSRSLQGPHLTSSLPIPTNLQDPPWEQRMHWLDTLQRERIVLQTHWGLSNHSFLRASKQLQRPPLDITSIQALSKKLPPTRRDLMRFDNALRQTTLSLLLSTNPGTFQYLDEMRQATKLPKLAHPHPLSWRRANKQRIARWWKQAQTQTWRSWRLALLVEQRVHHPSLSHTERWERQDKERARKQLRRCLQTLDHAMRWIPQGHPLTKDITHRIKLHRAWLKKVRTK